MHPLVKNSTQNAILKYTRVALSILIVLSTFNPLIIASGASENVTSIAVKTSPTTIVYTEGSELDLSGLEVTLANSDFSTSNISFADFAINGLTTVPVNGSIVSSSDTSVTITHTSSGQTTTQAITVNAVPVTVTSIAVKTSPTTIVYTEGVELDLSGLEVTLTMSDFSTANISFADFTSNDLTTAPINGTILSTSNNSVTITHTSSGKTTTQSITVNAVPVTVTSLAIKTSPTIIVYTEGAELDLSGLEVTLTNSDYSTSNISFADFAINGLTTTPVNSSILSSSDTSVAITHTSSGQTTTQAITINAVSTTTSTSVSGSGGGGGGSLSSGEKYENILLKDYALKAVVKDIETVFSFYKEDNSIVSVSFTSKLNGGQVKAVVEMLAGTSSQVSSGAPGNVYKNMNMYVDSNLASDVLGNSKVNFKVEKSWINENAIDLSTITLCRYSGSNWDQLSTEQKGEDDFYFYFVSTTPDFSQFAISSVEPSVVVDENIAEDVASSPDAGDTVMSTGDAVSMGLTTEVSQESKSSLPSVFVLALLGTMFIAVLGYRNRDYYNKVRLQIGNPDGKRYRRIKQ